MAGPSRAKANPNRLKANRDFLPGPRAKKQQASLFKMGGGMSTLHEGDDSLAQARELLPTYRIQQYPLLLLITPDHEEREAVWAEAHQGKYGHTVQGGEVSPEEAFERIRVDASDPHRLISAAGTVYTAASGPKYVAKMFAGLVQREVLSAQGVDGTTTERVSTATDLVTGAAMGAAVGAVAGPAGAAIGAATSTAVSIGFIAAHALANAGRGPDDNCVEIFLYDSKVTVSSYNKSDDLKLKSYWNRTESEDGPFVISAGQPLHHSFKLDIYLEDTSSAVSLDDVHRHDLILVAGIGDKTHIVWCRSEYSDEADRGDTKVWVFERRINRRHSLAKSVQRLSARIRSITRRSSQADAPDM